MDARLEAVLADLPERPGVYLFRDAAGVVLYVGKAQSLRHRVRSHWQRTGAAEAQRIQSVIDRVAEVECTLTDSVSEALLLEAALIKHNQPRFNVRLKDDKSYPFIRVTLADDFPRVERTRRLVQDGSRYFGPYASAGSVDAAMDLIRRLFPFRTCTLDIPAGERVLTRPCLLYDIGRCQGPCIQAVDREAYRRDIEQVMLFLDGKQEAVARALRREMEGASAAQSYERAAVLRDQLRAVERTMETQKVAEFSRVEEDVVGLALSGEDAAVQVFMIRDGRMVGRDVFPLANAGGEPVSAVLGAFVKQFYLEPSASGTFMTQISHKNVEPPPHEERRSHRRRFTTSSAPSSHWNSQSYVVRHIPPRILVSNEPTDRTEIQAALSGLRGTRVVLHVPRRGGRRQLVAMAVRNAEEALARLVARRRAESGDSTEALALLAEALGLPAAPQRIECYDISTIQGADSVGSMVTFEEGVPFRSGYRRFRIRTVEGADDYASHREVLRRRFRRALGNNDGGSGGGGDGDDLRWRAPDLVLIDGGRGQVAAARHVMEELGLHDVPLAGIAKEREELFLPGQADPVVLAPTSSALYLVQRLRDEAHRFAVGYHRTLRSRRQTRSALDDVPGLGPKRRGALLRAFGSLRGVRSATVEEIAAVPGMGPATAARVREALDA